MIPNIQIKMEMKQEASCTPAPEPGRGTKLWGLLAERWARAWDEGPWEGNPGSASVSGTGKSQ